MHELDNYKLHYILDPKGSRMMLMPGLQNLSDPQRWSFHAIAAQITCANWH